MRLAWSLALALSAASCTVTEDAPPGCRLDHPDDCDPGWTCREGTCFRYTTEAGIPDDAGDAKEAASDGPDASEAASGDAESDAADGSTDAPAEAPDDGPDAG